jgi:hypothetical protein
MPKPEEKWMVIVDYLDLSKTASKQDVRQLATFYVVDQVAGRQRANKIIRDGLSTLESSMEVIIPPHRILKVSVGELKRGKKV